VSDKRLSPLLFGFDDMAFAFVAGLLLGAFVAGIIAWSHFA
jgi:hypothetical protein